MSDVEGGEYQIFTDTLNQIDRAQRRDSGDQAVRAAAKVKYFSIVVLVVISIRAKLGRALKRYPIMNYGAHCSGPRRSHGVHVIAAYFAICFFSSH
jgi:hypothetical protein